MKGGGGGGGGGVGTPLLTMKTVLPSNSVYVKHVMFFQRGKM